MADPAGANAPAPGDGPGVFSEVGVLRSVLVCAPGLAHERLTSENCRALLFDEVMDVERARHDHTAFVAEMVARGVEVVELGEILAESLASRDARDWLLNRLAATATPDVRAYLDELPGELAARAVMGGVAVSELPADVRPRDSGGDPSPGRTEFVLPPLPNLLYARDSASRMYGGVTLNTFRFAARYGETAVLDALYRFHPRLARVRVWTGGDEPGPSVESIEGGDLLVPGNAPPPPPSAPLPPPCSPPAPPPASSSPPFPASGGPCTWTRS